MVDNTVAHIQNKESKTYTLNTATVSQMMTTVLAFLLSNGMLCKPGSLVFFTDGARDLRSAIFDLFTFLIILDWYHLEKMQRSLKYGNQWKTGEKSDDDRVAGLAVAWQG